MENENNLKKLAELREQIDSLDKTLIETLSTRLKIVKEVGEVKSKLGMPVFVPEREKSIFEAKRKLAEEIGISPDYIEEILRRVIKESYQHEKSDTFKCMNENINDIVIIGGEGNLGSLFRSFFEKSNYSVKSLDKNNWADAQALFSNASLIIVCVPINKTIEVIDSLKNYDIPKSCILADFTSIKEKPLNAMLNSFEGTVVGLHPMFGPDIKSFTKQVIIETPGRNPQKYAWLLEQFKVWGAIVEQVDAKVHDKNMSLIQALRHFTTFAYGVHLEKENPNLDELLKMSSPIYKLELMMVGRLFAQNGELYSDIIMSSDNNIEMVNKYFDTFKNLLKILNEKDKQKFLETFNKTTSWFGDYSDFFLKESQTLLKNANN